MGLNFCRANRLTNPILFLILKLYLIHICTGQRKLKALDEKILKKSSKTFRVNEVCAFLGITPRILKHYEEKGILRPDRTGGNDYRAYSAEEIMKIQTAEKLKKMGLSMNEIQLYFSGKIDLNELHRRLTVQRDMIDSLLNLVEVEMRIGKPVFEIFEETTCLCFVKEYPLTSDIPQKYLDARDAYSCAVGAGCRCDGTRNFFLQCDGLLSYLNTGAQKGVAPDQILQFAQNGKIGYAVYRACIPVLSAPESLHASGTVKKVTRKKSLMFKMAGEPLGEGKLFLMIAEEAKKRNLRPTGNVWLISETGPNKKTAEHTYTLVAAAEIE